MLLYKETLKLLPGSRKHITILVAPIDVAFIELVVLLAINRINHFYIQVLVALQDAAVALVWCKAVYDNAASNTMLAVRAVRPVHMGAAAAKANLGKVCMKFRGNRVLRIDK